MTRLEATLDDIVGKLRGNGFPNEQSISQGIVLRVLGDLNWDVYDPAIVWPEYQTGEGRPDFALCHPPRKPRIFIEVKQPGRAEHGLKQAMVYAFQTSGELFIVLTDGATWSFYLPTGSGGYEERLVFMLDLLKRPPAESANILSRYLERSRVVSGDAIRIAQEEHKNKSDRVNIRKAWNGLVGKREKSLIDLLANSVEAESGVRPEDANVIGFLASLYQSSALSLAPQSKDGTNIVEQTPTGVDTPNVPTPRDDTPPGDDTTPATTRPGRPSRWDGRIIRSTCAKNPRRPGTKGWRAHAFIMDHPEGVIYKDYRAAGHTSNHLDHDEKRGYITFEEKDHSSPHNQGTNTPMPPSKGTNISKVPSSRSVTLHISGENIACKNATDAVVRVLNRLQKRNPNFFTNFAGDPGNIKPTRRFVSESVERLYTNPKYRKYHTQLDGGWFLSTNYNNEYKRKILVLAAKVAGLTFGPGQDIDVDF